MENRVDLTKTKNEVEKRTIKLKLDVRVVRNSHHLYRRLQLADENHGESNVGQT